MNIVHDVSIGNPPEELNVIVEIPKGSKNKYELDKATGLIALDRVLPGPQVYPMEYCLVPQTHWHDGDPLDAVIYNPGNSFYPGVLVPVRPVGVVRMIDNGERDEKLICVPSGDPRLAQIKDKDDIAPHVLKELVDFFENYKNLEGKKVTIEKIEGRDAAFDVVKEAQTLYQKQFGSK
ncbi:MAG: inorganic diphosphatase [bacterium]|nr:inorganic diphosphatase [bacterium]